MAQHELKTWPVPFEAVFRGFKTAELRRDERGFSVGDRLLLREWCPTQEKYTGRQTVVYVTHIIRDTHFDGLMPGFVVLSIHA